MPSLFCLPYFLYHSSFLNSFTSVPSFLCVHELLLLLTHVHVIHVGVLDAHRNIDCKNSYYKNSYIIILIVVPLILYK